MRERERAATVLQQVNHELEQRVSTRTASLLQANVLLEQRVSDLASLNRITESLVLWPNMPEALEVVGATIQKLFEAVHVVVWQVEGNRLAAMPLVPHATQTQIPALQIADDAVATCVINGKTMVLVAGAAAPAFFKHHVHSDGVLTGDVILVPLADYSQNNGLLMIGPARPPRVYSPTDITLAQTIASALAGTLQNLRLLRETQYQHAVSEALRDVLSALVEKVDLPTMLRSLLTQLGRVIHYDSAAIFLHQATDLVIVDGRGAAENFRGQRLPLDFDHPAGRVFHARAPLVVADAAILEEWTVWRGCSRSWAGVPLLHMGVAIGVLTLAREQPSAVSQDDIRLLEAFANQATIAIYNAQRYRLAETVATDRERRRIAREVHDSVNQTLFAAHAAATMLPLVYAREPAAGEQTLAELQQLIGMAQIEMRSLLYELRPSILSMNPLSDLLVALAHSTQTKLRVEAGISLDQTPLLPAEAQIALYRIAQEALHNIFKHARPTTIRFSLTLAPPFEVTQTQPWQGLLTLVIEDDGGGFESAVPTSGIGLTSMRERAKGIGAELSIVSRSGAGTSIRATWRGSARIV